MQKSHCALPDRPGGRSAGGQTVINRDPRDKLARHCKSRFDEYRLRRAYIPSSSLVLTGLRLVIFAELYPRRSQSRSSNQGLDVASQPCRFCLGWLPGESFCHSSNTGTFMAQRDYAPQGL